MMALWIVPVSSHGACALTLPEVLPPEQRNLRQSNAEMKRSAEPGALGQCVKAIQPVYNIIEVTAPVKGRGEPGLQSQGEFHFSIMQPPRGAFTKGMWRVAS